MTDWVPVMAPPELAARMLREVADHIAAGREFAEVRPWEDATGTDVRDFLRLVTADQSKLLVSLAFAEEAVPAAQHAQRLGVSVDDLAGYVGPLNKRAKKSGWMSPIRSERHFGKGADKVLVLDERVAMWVRNNHEDERS